MDDCPHGCYNLLVNKNKSEVQKMANVTINDNTKYVELSTLDDGDYFILSGELYLVADSNNAYYTICFNLSDGENRREIDDDTKVLPVPSSKVKIKVEI
jgi:hypothetical protein